MDKLPAPYNVLTYGVDVVGLKDRSLVYMEGNAGWESQYFYADTDVWVANLMAAHYAAQPTPFLQRFRRFAATKGLRAKIHRLRQLLKHKWLHEAVSKVDPVTEVLARARAVLLDDVPPVAVARQRRADPAGDHRVQARAVSHPRGARRAGRAGTAGRAGRSRRGRLTRPRPRS